MIERRGVHLREGASRAGARHRRGRVRGVRRRRTGCSVRGTRCGGSPAPGFAGGLSLPAGVARVVADLRDDASVRAAFALPVRRGLPPRRAGTGTRLPRRPRRVLARPTSAAPWRSSGARGAGRLAAAAGRRVDLRGVRRARRCPRSPRTSRRSRRTRTGRASSPRTGPRRPGRHRAIGAVGLRGLRRRRWLPGHADRDETRLVPKAVAVVQGRAPELVVNGDGGAVRDYVHVADMADAFALRARRVPPGPLDGIQRG